MKGCADDSNEICCHAVAYSWAISPAGFGLYDIAVSIVLVSGRLKFEDTHSIEWTGLREPEVLGVHANLPPEEAIVSMQDISGTIGLLWPLTDRSSTVRAAAFERLVSDAVISLLSRTRIEGSARNIVLLQGPLLPKLRGRFLYRTVDENTTVFAVTYLPKWFNRIKGAESAYYALSNRPSRTPTGGAITLYPPAEVDSGTRSWICMFSGTPYHYEVISNTWEPSENSDWLTDCERDIYQLMHPDSVESVDTSALRQVGQTPLPTPLANATRRAGQCQEREEIFYRIYMLYRDYVASRGKKRIYNILRTLESEPAFDLLFRDSQVNHPQLKLQVEKERNVERLAATHDISVDVSAEALYTALCSHPYEQYSRLRNKLEFHVRGRE